MYPVSATFNAQRTADSNVLRRKCSIFFPCRGWGLTGYGSTWNAQSPFTALLAGEDSVFDPLTFGVTDLGQGNVSHRNFAQAEGNALLGFGWQSGLRFSGASGAATGTIARDLASTVDGRISNNGQQIAQRFTAPSIATAPKLVQIAMRIEFGSAQVAQVVTIQTDAAGLPSGVVLATLSLDPTTIVSDWSTIDITPLSLTAGTPYWIVIAAASVSDAAHSVTWGEVGSTATVDGNLERAATNNGGGWVGQAYRQHYRTAFDSVSAVHGEQVTVLFGQSRTITQVRVYSYPSGISPLVTKLGIRTFLVQLHVGGLWVAANVSSATGSDYNAPRLTPNVSSGNQVSDPQATYFEVNLAAPVSCDGVRLVITAVQDNATFASLIGVEAYWEQDVSDRVKSVEIQHKRDTLLDLDQSAALTMECDNSDRYFSDSYLPTPVQVANGFVNSLWNNDLEIRYREGFNNNEFVPQGIFYLDGTPLIQARGRIATLSARDWSKKWEETYLNEVARLNDSLTDLVSLVANRSNWSQSRMVLANTVAIVNLWAPNGTTCRQEMEYLAQAAPVQTIRYDLSGNLVSVQYLPSMSANPIEYSFAGFQIGTYDFDQSYDVPVYCANQKVYTGPKSAVGSIIVMLQCDPYTGQIVPLFEVIDSPTPQFSQIVLSADASTLYAASGKHLYKYVFATGVLTTLDITTAIPGFDHIGNRNCQSVIANGLYYFTVVAIVAGVARELLCSVNASTFTLVSVSEMGVMAIGTAGVVDSSNSVVTRMIRWTQPGRDWIIWAYENMSFVRTNSAFDLTGQVMVPANSFPNDITRTGVCTDGTYLYETVHTVAPVVTAQRRDSSDNILNEFTATINSGTPNGNVGIAYMGGRLLLAITVLVGPSYSPSSLIFQNVLVVFNIQDSSVYQVINTQSSVLGVIVDDVANGMACYLESPDVAYLSAQPGSGTNVAHLAFRTLLAPNNPITSSLIAAWNGELLDCQYQSATDNNGNPTAFTLVRWSVTPVVISGSPVPVWVASLGGLAISGTNTMTIPPASSIAFQARGSTGYPGPRYIAKRPRVGRFSVPNSGNFGGFACPNLAGSLSQGPAGFEGTAADLTTPQRVHWSCVNTSTQRIQTVLTPHPTAPTLSITNPDPLVPAVVSELFIQALPYVPGNQSYIEVFADESVVVSSTNKTFLENGTLIRQQHGNTAKEVQTPYVSDVALAQLAAHEVLRLYGVPIKQVKNAAIVPSPQIELEDIVRVQEPESGIDLTAVVTGVTRRRSDHDNKDDLELQALPYASIFGVSPAPSTQSLANQPSMASV